MKRGTIVVWSSSDFLMKYITNYESKVEDISNYNPGILL